MAADDVRNEPDYSHPYAPPTQTAGPQLPPRPSKWPTVIGIVAIAFAGLGIMGGFCGLVTMVTMPSMMPQDPATTAALSATRSSWMVVQLLVGLGLTVLLLICGIGLLKRRPWSPKGCTRWAVVYIIFAVIGGILNFSMQQAQFASMSQAGGPSPMPVGFGTLALLMSLLGFVWACALPVFLLVWFSRAKIKAEVALWGCDDSGDAPMQEAQ